MWRCISSRPGDAFEYEMSLSTELTLALHVTVDVHTLNGAPLGFCHAVLQGEVLFAREAARSPASFAECMEGLGELGIVDDVH